MMLVGSAKSRWVSEPIGRLGSKLSSTFAVRCHGNRKLLRMLQQKRAMPIYQRDEQENVIDQVGSFYLGEWDNRLTLNRQFQDLERQLQQARQQVAHFRSILPKGVLAMEADLSSLPYPGAEPQSGGLTPARRKKPTAPGDFTQVRTNLIDYGRGVMRIPSPPRVMATSQSNKHPEMPEPPPRQIAERLLAAYHENFHPQFPILHWPTFESECDQLYRRKSLAPLGTPWGAVFLCVLACGTLHTLDSSRIQDGKAFLTSAIGLTNRWQDEFSVEDARMAFLTGVFLTELNLRSAGWVWLGSAMRISQDIGLDVESGPWSPVEREMRRSLWYCIYVWDRYSGPVTFPAKD